MKGIWVRGSLWGLLWVAPGGVLGVLAVVPRGVM